MKFCHQFHHEEHSFAFIFRLFFINLKDFKERSRSMSGRMLEKIFKHGKNIKDKMKWKLRRTLVHLFVYFTKSNSLHLRGYERTFSIRNLCSMKRRRAPTTTTVKRTARITNVRVCVRMRACVFVRLFHHKTHIRLQFGALLRLSDLEQKFVALAIIFIDCSSINWKRFCISDSISRENCPVEVQHDNL